MAHVSEWKWKFVGIVIAIGAVVGYRSWRGPARLTIPIVRGEMPPCDSSAVRHLLVKTIEASPATTKEGLKLIKIGNVIDALDDNGTLGSKDPRKDYRRCSAVVFSNTGKEDVDFRISWMDDAKSTLWLEGE